MEGKFKGRNILSQPTCPFCGMAIERPKELAERMPHEMPVGSCDCGAVFACDVTGHNLGTAMIEALVFGCNGDWDLAWDLLPEEDYVTKEIESYDYKTHLIVHSPAYNGRNITGVLFFIRLHRDVREVTEAGVKEKLKQAPTPPHQPIREKKGKKPFTKKEIESLVNTYDLESLLNLAHRDKRIIRDLQRLLYSADPLVRLRTADVLGRVAAIIARQYPASVSRLLQVLIISITDTAASSWGALDAIGEIISHSPKQFAAFVPQLYPFFKDRDLLLDALQAMERITRRTPGPFQKLKFRFIPLLEDPDPQIRGHASILLGNLHAKEAKPGLSILLNDPSEVDVYENGYIIKQTVGKLAEVALSKL